MSLWLQKLVMLLLEPLVLGFFLFLILIALTLSFLNKKNVSRILAILGVSWIFVFSLPFISWHLANYGKTPKVVISAGALPFDALLLESKSATTYQNAIYTKKLLNAHADNIILVTSASHMKRAVATFIKTGFRVIPALTDYQSLGKIGGRWKNFIPCVGALQKSTKAIKEIVGYWVYLYRGWI